MMESVDHQDERRLKIKYLYLVRKKCGFFCGT